MRTSIFKRLKNASAEMLKNMRRMKIVRRIAARKLEFADDGTEIELDDEKLFAGYEKFLREVREETEAFRFMDDGEILEFIEYCVELRARILDIARKAAK